MELIDVISGSEKSSSDNWSDYDHAKEVKEFYETKAGVKGLVDSGILKIPKLFIQPSEKIQEKLSDSSSDTYLQVPVINLGGFDGKSRKEIVNEIRHAAETWGFFQMVNHCIPVAVMDEVLEAARRFHEQPTKVKMEFYTNDARQQVRFHSNPDLPNSLPANWRDSMAFNFQDHQLDFKALPQLCREAISEYVKRLIGLKEMVSELLSEALGLDSDYLSSIECMKSETLLSHYYPACPQPELTIGTSSHSDVSFMTILLQDNIGGLQVLHQNQWVDVPHLHRALIANLGDFMQLVTNDKFKSVEHRVLANKIPRVSVACFFVPSTTCLSKPYGPVKELLSDNNPPVYKETPYYEYVAYYRAKGLDGCSALQHFKL